MLRNCVEPRQREKKLVAESNLPRLELTKESFHCTLNIFFVHFLPSILRSKKEYVQPMTVDPSFSIHSHIHGYTCIPVDIDAGGGLFINCLH